MKRIFCILLLVAHCGYSQDEIILRKTQKTIWDELEIKKVTKDSITYKPAGRKSKEVTLPIHDIIAYRKDYESKTNYIVPNPADEEKYKFVHGRAVDEDMNVGRYATNKSMDAAITLRQYVINSPFDDGDLISNNKITLVKKSSGKRVIKGKKARIYIKVKVKADSTYSYSFAVRKYMFGTDNTVYFRFKTKKKSEKTYYAVKLSEITQIGIQTPGMVIAKISIGLVELAIPFTYFYGGAIIRMIHPMYRKFDLKKWNVNVTEGPRVQ